MFIMCCSHIAEKPSCLGWSAGGNYEPWKENGAPLMLRGASMGSIAPELSRGSVTFQRLCEVAEIPSSSSLPEPD